MSTAGGLSTCIPRAQAMGAECIQIFLSAPQRWQHPKHTDEQVGDYKLLMADANIGPNFAHATYLVNLASPDEGIRQRSVDNLVATAECCDRAGLAGLVIHIGSARGQPHADAEALIVSGLEAVLANSGQCAILLENSAGSGDLLGSRFEQIGQILDRLGGHARVGLCLDTAHTFASGYDLRIDDGIQAAVDEVTRYVGIDRLKLIHANDSKVGLNSYVDRHENIGKGQLGEGAFKRLLKHPALEPVAWVLEVPGYDDKGPDKANLDELKRLADRV